MIKLKSGLLIAILLSGILGSLYFLVRQNSASKEFIFRQSEPATEAENPDGEPEGEFFSDEPQSADGEAPAAPYPIHKKISTTLFWIGEKAGKENNNISNLPSAWDEDWVKHYGGTDDPKRRKGFFPAAFVPKENPFYFALPYNDFDQKGKRKKSALVLPAWAQAKPYKGNESVCKNRWIKITKDGKAAYAQWEDVGPFEEDDKNYVFGSAKPKSKINNYAGLDVSPAVHEYLGLKNIDEVDWQFVDEQEVPDGPWKKIITRSQINWK